MLPPRRPLRCLTASLLTLLCVAAPAAASPPPAAPPPAAPPPAAPPPAAPPPAAPPASTPPAPTPTPKPAAPTWTIAPVPPVSPDSPAPSLRWFADGRRVLFTLQLPADTASDTHPSLWVFDTDRALSTLLAASFEDAAPSPDGQRLAIATRTTLRLLPFHSEADPKTSTAPANAPADIPWPGHVAGARRLIAWLDDHTLLRVQQHDAEPSDPDADDAYGLYTYQCDTLDLRASPPTPTPTPCPEAGFSYLAKITSDGAGRVLLLSSAEGCIDLTAALYAPPKPQQPLGLPPLHIFPSSDLLTTFTLSKDLLLVSPCDLDDPSPPGGGCLPDLGPAPWHLFLWNPSLDRPKRLYAGLPPASLPDASARRVTWPSPGGLCVASLDPPSAPRCWRLP